MSSRVTQTAPNWLVRFGQRLERLRVGAGLTQEAFAGSDLTKSFISLIETGRSSPSIDTLLHLAQRARTSIGALLLDGNDLRFDTALSLLTIAANSVAERPRWAARVARMIDDLIPDMPLWLRGETKNLLGAAAFEQNRLVDANQLAREALKIASRSSSGLSEARALFLRGRIALHQRKFLVSLSLLSDAVERFRESKALRSTSGIDALVHLASAAGMSGQNRTAWRHYEKAVALSQRLQLVMHEGRAVTGLALIAWKRGDLRQSVRLMRRAITAFEREESLRDLAMAVANLGTLYRELGQLHLAREALERGIRIKTQLGDVRGRSATSDELARLFLQQQDLRRAQTTARQALEDANTVRDAYLRAYALATLGRVDRAQGHLRQATGHLREAARVFKQFGLRDEAGDVGRDLQLLRSREGRGEEATAYLAQALQERSAKNRPAIPRLVSTRGSKPPEPRSIPAALPGRRNRRTARKRSTKRGSLSST